MKHWPILIIFGKER